MLSKGRKETRSKKQESKDVSSIANSFEEFVEDNDEMAPESLDSHTDCTMERQRYIHTFIQTKHLPFQSEVDNEMIRPRPLGWCKENSQTFPFLSFARLAVVARKYLSVPATSAPVARLLFSKAGLTISAKRSRR
jgi:hypothetical protein